MSLFTKYLEMVQDEKLTKGLGDNKPDSDFNKEELEKGIKIEMEHTDDPKIAKEIAKDHLSEISDYYTRLIKMEKEADE